MAKYHFVTTGRQAHFPMALSGQQAEDAIDVSLTLKALANSSPGLQQPWESSSNLCRSRTLKEFAKAPAHRWQTLSAL